MGLIKLLFEDIELSPEEPEDALGDKIKSAYGISCSFNYEIIRKSLDARDKGRIVYRYKVLAEIPESFKDKLLNMRGVTLYSPKIESPAIHAGLNGLRVIIVGSGPAGLFCALRLIDYGAGVLILERGKKVEERIGDIHLIENSGILNTESNVLFGEGGAGTYSDGKLTTRIHKPEVDYFFKKIIEMGAQSSVLYEQKPHLGTDRLCSIIKRIRQSIIDSGSTIRFNERVDDIISPDNSAAGVITSSGMEHRGSAIVLATGHSARDIYRLLQNKGVALEKKGFAVGLRIEHPRELIDSIQYGAHNQKKMLPAAEYRLTYNNKKTGRGIYSFCMCPGGEIINSSSEEKMLCVNGMSYSKRNGLYSNAAIIVTIKKEELPDSPVAGIEFQRVIEQKAYEAGGGGFFAPAQRLSSFVSGKTDNSLPGASYKPGIRLCAVNAYLPEWIKDELVYALKSFDRKMKGYICNDGVLIGAETRSSSPVRITRNEDFQSVSIKGLYPVGEGAGYAGGIVSSAVDGIRAADMICRRFGKSD